MNGGAVAGISIACFLVGLIGGFFVFRFITKRELKKNPPINKDQVRALLRATGRTPSEADVERAMKAMNDAKSPNYNPYAGMSKKKEEENKKDLPSGRFFSLLIIFSLITFSGRTHASWDQSSSLHVWLIF